MKRLIIAAALAAMAGSALGSDFAVGANVISLHNKSGYETVTPGLYVRGNDEWFGELGVFRNSLGFATAHAAVGYSHKHGDWDASLALGFSYGYRDRHEWYYPDGSAPNFYTYGPPKVNPLVMPSISYRLDSDWGLRTFVIPAIKGRTDSWCLSFALERYF